MILPRRILLAALAISPSFAEAAAGADDWFTTLMAQLARIPERRARFVEERKFAALTVPLVSQGELYYRQPGHLEKTTTAPQPERLVVDGETLTITNADGGYQTVSLTAHPEAGVLVEAIRGPLSGNLNGIEQHYHVSISGSAEAWRMILEPADALAMKLLRSVVIDGSNLAIRVIAITQANGDTQRMTIQDAA